MLYRSAALFLKQGQISRRYSYTVVAMRFYPRFLPRELVDEYLRDLAPDAKLFAEFKAKDRELKDHERAFEEVGYERRFSLSPSGKEHLERLTELARQRDVFLLCQCLPLERCHTDLLLLLARHWFGADTQQLRITYPLFSQRLAAGELG